MDANRLATALHVHFRGGSSDRRIFALWRTRSRSKSSGRTRRSELRELEHKPKEPVDLPLAVGLFTERLDDGAADADLQPLSLRGRGRTGEPARGHATPRGGRRVGIGDDVAHQKAVCSVAVIRNLLAQ